MKEPKFKLKKLTGGWISERLYPTKNKTAFYYGYAESTVRRKETEVARGKRNG